MEIKVVLDENVKMQIIGGINFSDEAPIERAELELDDAFKKLREKRTSSVAATIMDGIANEKMYTQFAVDEILSENRRLKAENDYLNGKIATFEIVTGDLKSWYTKNGYAPNVEIRRTDGEKESSGKEVCDCGKLREKINDLQSQIADITKQYDSLRDEYEMTCLKRENLAKQIKESEEQISEINDRCQ